MVKGGIKALLVTTIAVSLILPFTFFSFADPYLGTEFIVNSDGTVELKNNNPSGQTFSSGSQIQYNVWNNNPVIDDNTFNGSTSITNTFNQLTSADNNFTGNTTLQVVDGGGNIESNLDTFNTMTVAAAGTNLNFNDSTFQGAVNINDAGVVQIGSTTESAQIVTNTGNTVTQLQSLNTVISNLNSTVSTLNNFVSYIHEQLCVFQYHVITNYSVENGQGTTVNITKNGRTYTVPLAVYYNYNFSYDSNNNSIFTGSTIRRGTFLAIWVSHLGAVVNFGQAVSQYFMYEWNNFWSAYLPNKPLSQSNYWIAYNTDTDSYDSVNFATVFGYITWYLGQMYIQGNEAAADISDSVNDMATAFTDLETKESQINSNIKSSLNNVDSFFNLPAIASGSVVIGWLQYMWVSLGMFQGVTIVAWALIILTIVTGFYKVKRITV